MVVVVNKCVIGPFGITICVRKKCVQYTKKINTFCFLHNLNMDLSASKTSGTTVPTVDELYEIYMMKKTRDVLKDTSHPLHEFYDVAQSGCRCISERTRTNRYRNTFLPTSVRLLNATSGRGK